MLAEAGGRVAHRRPSGCAAACAACSKMQDHLVKDHRYLAHAEQPGQGRIATLRTFFLLNPMK